MYDQVMAVTFDTLKASRRLQDAGFDEEKADALVSIFRRGDSAQACPRRTTSPLSAPI